METEPLPVPPAVKEHYHARRFSGECVTALHDFIKHTPSMLLRDPHEVKSVVKVAVRIAAHAPRAIDLFHLRRAHDYAH
jgi:hypothetical protein